MELRLRSTAPSQAAARGLAGRAARRHSRDNTLQVSVLRCLPRRRGNSRGTMEVRRDRPSLPFRRPSRLCHDTRRLGCASNLSKSSVGHLIDRIFTGVWGGLKHVTYVSNVNLVCSNCCRGFVLTAFSDASRLVKFGLTLAMGMTTTSKPITGHT
jgi:hypothetical protein